MLDRIDYNVEQTLTEVKAGVVEIDEAEEYQKSNRSCLVYLMNRTVMCYDDVY